MHSYCKKAKLSCTNKTSKFPKKQQNNEQQNAMYKSFFFHFLFLVDKPLSEMITKPKCCNIATVWNILQMFAKENDRWTSHFVAWLFFHQFPFYTNLNQLIKLICFLVIWLKIQDNHIHFYPNNDPRKLVFGVSNQATTSDTNQSV